MVNAIAKSTSSTIARITRASMAALLLAVQLLVAIVGVNQFPGTVLAESATKTAGAAENITVSGGKAWAEANNIASENSVSDTVLLGSPPAPPAREDGKVTICHATNSALNPYRAITVALSAVDGIGNNDHSSHVGPVFNTSIHNQQDRGWGDIIPPVPGSENTNVGLNWNTEGAAIWNNDCKLIAVTPTGTVIITKLTVPSTSTSKFSFESEDLDIDDSETIGHGESITREYVVAGAKYTVSENLQDGYALTDIKCNLGNETTEVYDFSLKDSLVSLEDSSVSFTLEANETVECVFTNTQDEKEQPEPGIVKVTKYEDIDRDGERDENEPTLEGWEITLACTRAPVSDRQGALLPVEAVSNCNERSGITGKDGGVTFGEVAPNKRYTVGEVLQDNWVQTGIACDTRQDLDDSRLNETTEDDQVIPSNTFDLREAQTVDCEIGNARDLVLRLQKSNNSTAPQVRGDVITYTLTVSLPVETSVSYNTVVTDLPPENFKYNGVYSFELTTASPLRVSLEELMVPDPNYQSPGNWSLGTMYPGEVVTLTYQAVINSQVSPGLYPDVAFLRGYTSLDEDAAEVLGNSTDNPFVQTDVLVVLGQSIGNTSFQPTTAVLGALVNTGEKPHILHYLLPVFLVLNTLLLITISARTTAPKGTK